MKAIPYLVIFCLLLAACKKEVTVTGRVYNPITNEGIPGIKVSLVRQKAGVPGAMEGGGSTPLISVLTDAQGYFSITEKLKKTKTYDFRFIFSEDKYYPVEGYPYNVSYNDDHKEINLPLVPKGKLTVNINNISCQGPGDVLQLQRAHSPLPSYYTDIVSTINGCAHYPGSSESVPMGWHIFKGTVTKNNVSTPYLDSVYVAPGGSSTMNINY